MPAIVIRDGTVIDGTGQPQRSADVAIDGNQITAVGSGISRGDREINAAGALVMPGWVDVHTHYDGQVTWDPYLTPSSWHGVTTAVFGNCGVGFAPVNNGTEDYLINLMEGVEDIPGSVLAEGMDFSWQTFPEYLDRVDASPKVMDVAAQVPHGPLRFYVMGERGADHTIVPNHEEIETMGKIVEEALTVGAVGFSTSRTVKHRTADGRPTPSLSASEPELAGIAQAMRRANAGVIECNSDMGPGEMAILIDTARISGRPLSVLLLQINAEPNLWRETLSHIASANKAGLEVTGQVGCRPIGILMGLATSINPFSSHRAWQQIAELPLAEQALALRTNMSLRDQLGKQPVDDPHSRWIKNAFDRTYELSDVPDYEPTPSTSIRARAESMGISPWMLALDLLSIADGENFLLHTFENYTDGNFDVLHEMLTSEHTICGLGDAGAHVATICDAGYPTFMLQHWGRDRTRGPKLSLEFLVAKQTRKTAQAFGLLDRGVLAPGYRADLNIIDPTAIRVTKPRLLHDLPANGKRLIQYAEGYLHTFVGGVETLTNGEHTGALPGRLVRGSQRPPVT